MPFLCSLTSLIFFWLLFLVAYSAAFLAQSGLKVRYSRSARQDTCQNKILAVLFISFILLMVPLTMFEKPLLGLDQKLHLLLACRLPLRHHSTLLIVAEKTLYWCTVVRIWTTVNDRHLESLNLCTSLRCSIVPSVVHQDICVLPPEWTLRI